MPSDLKPMLTTDTLLIPDWPAPANVRAVSTTRLGGVSLPPYGAGRKHAGGLNLGTHVGDLSEHVAENRSRLKALLPSEPQWLDQVHGCAVVTASASSWSAEAPQQHPSADASVSDQPGVVCAIMTADCLPVLLCDRAGTIVGAAHAGWRGLCAGVLERTVEQMRSRAPLGDANEWLAWLGPAIGPQAFEVGSEVRSAFLAEATRDEMDATEAAFKVHSEASARRAGKVFADLYALARLRLARVSCTAVSGGDRCTYREEDVFFSYRRDQRTGRMASLIWLAE
jgi:YfiH family protein